MDDDYIVEIEDKHTNKKSLIQTFNEEFSQAEINAQLTQEESVKISTQKLTEEAEQKAEKILNDAENEAKQIVEKAQEEAKQILEKIQAEAGEQAQVKIEEIINDAKTAYEEQIEKQRVETINNAYQEGYEDGHKKLLEELDEKIKFFDKFCNSQYTIEQNILKATSKEILDIIIAISKKILYKEIDAEVLKKIIENSISLLENKENVNIILSEKYAKILYEFQKKSLNKDIDFDFKDFKQYENFNIIYSPEYKDDTIIVENIKERFDASVSSQLEIIIRNIEEKTQQNKIEIEEYKKIHEIE